MEEWRTQPRPPPIEGATWIDERTPAAAPPGMGAEAQGEQMLANQAMRAGLTVDDLRTRLAQSDVDRSFYPGVGGGSRGQDVQTLMDLDDTFARMAGSIARASPEARNRLEAFLTARQTGVTPRRGALGAESGLTVREPMTPRGKGPPAGQYERVHDAFKRALNITDQDYHGHGANPLRTEQQILQAAKDEAQPLYAAAYRAGEGVDLRPAVQPILAQWLKAANAEAPALGKEILRAARQFYARNGEMLTDIRRFDSAKQAVDDIVEGLLSKESKRNAARLVIQMRNELLQAVDSLPGVGPAYSTARAAFSDRMTARDILRRFRDAFRDESDVGADAFAALESREQQKLARLGLLWGFERMAGTERTRDITRFFNNPRVQDLLGRVMPSTGLEPSRATPADIAQRFGRFLQTERAQSQLRQRVLGGSPTAERLADDAAYESLHDVINSFRGSPGFMSAGIAYASRILNRLFGYQADAAMAMAMRMTVADPAARQRVLEQIARRMGRSRFEEFTRLMAEHQARAGALGTQAIVPPAASPQQPQGPEFL